VRLEVCSMKAWLDGEAAPAPAPAPALPAPAPAPAAATAATVGSADWSSASVAETVAGKHSSAGRGLCLYGGGDRAVSTDYSGEMILWDVSASPAGGGGGAAAASSAGSSCEVKRFQAHSTHTNGLSVSRDGSLIATGCDDGSVKLWTADGDAVRTLREAPAGSAGVYSVCFSADGTRVLAAGHHESSLLEFDVEGVRAVRSVPAGGVLMAVDASADGQWVVTTDSGGHVKIWDGTSLAAICTLDGSGSSLCYGACFSPDSSHVAVVSNDGHLRVWRASDWSRTIDIGAHSNLAYQVCWSSDSKQIVTSGGDKTVKVWEASSGRLLRTLTGHAGLISAVAMSADGQMIMSTGDDCTVRVWRHVA
jgi:WD40 repeat protein